MDWRSTYNRLQLINWQQHMVLSVNQDVRELEKVPKIVPLLISTWWGKKVLPQNHHPGKLSKRTISFKYRFTLFLFNYWSLFWVSPTNSKQINKQRLTCIQDWLTNKESTKELEKPETWNLHKWYVLLLLQVFSGPQKYTFENQRLEPENHPFERNIILQTSMFWSQAFVFFFSGIVEQI